MASRWGDDIDEELQRDNRIKVGILFNYMHMGKVIKQLEEETREWDQNYPGLIYWLMTVAVLGAAFALAWLFRGLIFGG